MIRTIPNGLCRCLAVDRIVQFVLNRRKKSLGRRGRWVIVQRGGVDVGDFLVKLAFRKPYLPNFFQLALKKSTPKMLPPCFSRSTSMAQP